MIMRIALYLFVILFLSSCKSDAELSMERGIHYYEWQKYNEAILESIYELVAQVIPTDIVVV